MMTDWLRGLALLRYPEVQRRLRDWIATERAIDELRTANPGTKISSQVTIQSRPGSSISLRQGVTIEAGTVLCLGEADYGDGALSVGEGTWIGPYNNLRAGSGRITIGRECLISQFCSLVATNHSVSPAATIKSQPPASAPRDVTLMNDVWLGAGCVILPGVTIGNGAVVGANAVVTKSIAPGEIWAGVPARKIGARG